MWNQESPIAQVLERTQNHGAQNAYCFKKDDQWHAVTWAQYGKDIENFAKGLIALGLQEGQCIGILGFNRAEWLTSCLGAQMAGGAAAGIYTNSSCEEVVHVLQHSGSAVVVVENFHRWQTQILPLMANLPALKKVILMTGTPPADDPLLMSFQQLLDLGKKEERAQLQDRIKAIKSDQLATLIYTSGTTGPAKAVMLSHRNIHWTVNTVTKLLKVGTGDTMLSYLPLAHIAEQMFSVYAPIASGLCIYFAQSLEAVPDNLKEVQPTVFFGVPRVYEKFYAKVKEGVQKASGLKALLLGWARRVATEVWTLKHGSEKPNTFLALQYAISQRLVFSKLKALLGLSRARLCVAGAAPISKDIISFFLGLDIPIYEVYGQSEGSGPTSFNIMGAAKLGCVGRPLPGVSVKIADDGEILVKGPNIFSGYFKDEEATKEALRNGWLHSGDIGKLDHQGYIKITDRKKDILITAGGKNIAPQNLEGMLKQIPMVSLAVVVGDRQKYLAALLTPNRENLTDFAQKNGFGGGQLNELVEDRRVLQEIEKAISEINLKLAPVEQIKKFRLLPNDFSVENGELTPTLKVKRKVVNRLYQETIEGFYQ